jgi:replication-associated recombination protein RarA
MSFELKTKHGHNMYDISSMLQKAIRRQDFDKAGYAAYELFGSFHSYLWKRLLVISAEDCYGIMTKEIIALKCSDDIVNKGKSGYDKTTLFVAKAVTLLCMASKNRDGCYFACNFMLPERCLNEDEIEHINIEECNLGVDGIPDYVYDCHTLKGKMNGMTEGDMIVDEQKALNPKQLSLFDDCDWDRYCLDKVKKGKMTDKQYQRYLVRKNENLDIF